MLKNFKKIVVATALVLAFVSASILYPNPKPAKAIFGIGDITVDVQNAVTQLLREIGSNLLMKANERYTQGFIAKSLQKFQINDYLSYAKTLSNTLYLGKLINQDTPLAAYAIKQLASGAAQKATSVQLLGTSGTFGLQIVATGATAGFVPITVPFDTNLNTTARDLATAINADAYSQVILDAVNNGSYVLLNPKSGTKTPQTFTVTPFDATDGDARIIVASGTAPLQEIYNKQAVDYFSAQTLLSQDSTDSQNSYMERLTNVLDSTPQGRQLAIQNEAATKQAQADAAAAQDISTGSGYKGSQTCTQQRFANSAYSTLDCAVNNPSNYVSNQVNSKIQSLYNDQTNPPNYFGSFIRLLGQTTAKALGDKLFAPGGAIDNALTPLPNFLPGDVQVDARANGALKSTLFDDIYNNSSQPFQNQTDIYNSSTYNPR